MWDEIGSFAAYFSAFQQVRAGINWKMASAFVGSEFLSWQLPLVDSWILLMEGLSPAAGHHIPSFISAPGETDFLLVFSGFLLVAAVLAAGVFFLWLHSLPERMVHNKRQYDIVAVLCLLALFTHVHVFWVAALILAYVKLPDIRLPDYQSPLRRIANSLDKLAAAPPAIAAPEILMTAAELPADQGKGGGKNA